MPKAQRALLLTIALIATAVACGARSGTPAAGGDEDAPTTAATAGEEPCEPLEAREPNAPRQRPEAPGQTRACGVTSELELAVEVFATGLVHPWAVEPLPGGDLLVTERPGRMRVVSAAGELGPPLEGLPPVVARRQGGLLDVAPSPQFASDRLVYWSFSEPRQDGNGTSVARARLSADGRRLEGVEVVFRARPAYGNGMHYGSRLAFGPGGMLYVTTGERSDASMREHAQRLDSHLGKTLRIRPEGGAPPDNPFVGQAGALPEIWSYGHRNAQAMAFDPAGRLWQVEHGARGGDELNLIERGANYGWPLQAYGEEYSGRSIRSAETGRPGMKQPIYYWDPVIAPSGAEVYTGDAFPEWRGNLFVGALKEQRLVRLVLEDGRVAGEEHLLADRGKRIRDVRQSPDGTLWVVTDESRGELWRIVPRR